jgi:two-component system, OmpR family, KDP operon response regulator KdpE
MKAAKILIIEDEVSIRRFLRFSLESNSFTVIEATNGQEGVSLTASHRPDVVLLDIGLPDMDGFSVIEQIRSWSKVPIVVLTVHDQEDDKVRALDVGADDYLTKPFGVPELLARLRALLRRVSSEQEQSPIFRSGPFEMDRAAHIVRVSGKEVHLTSTEYDLLSVLVKHAGKVVTHRMLLNEVWGPNSVEHIQYLRVYLGQIRKKLKITTGGTEIISTEPGVGYRFLLESP